MPKNFAQEVELWPQQCLHHNLSLKGLQQTKCVQSPTRSANHDLRSDFKQPLALIQTSSLCLLFNYLSLVSSVQTAWGEIVCSLKFSGLISWSYLAWLIWLDPPGRLKRTHHRCQRTFLSLIRALSFASKCMIGDGGEHLFWEEASFLLRFAWLETKFFLSH